MIQILLFIICVGLCLYLNELFPSFKVIMGAVLGVIALFAAAVFFHSLG
ncbi:hypothetical protein [Polynucleobacter asymbioticus]|nr:hypothetical protein [Polynucleobacter asymbioticus]